MVDLSGVRGSSSNSEQPQNQHIQEMQQNLQQLEQQVGHCSKAVQESKEALVEDIMNNISEIQQQLEQLKSLYPGDLNKPDVNDLLNQLNSLSQHGNDISPQDLNKISIQINVVRSLLSS